MCTSCEQLYQGQDPHLQPVGPGLPQGCGTILLSGPPKGQQVKGTSVRPREPLTATPNPTYATKARGLSAETPTCQLQLQELTPHPTLSLKGFWMLKKYIRFKNESDSTPQDAGFQGKRFMCLRSWPSPRPRIGKKIRESTTGRGQRRGSLGEICYFSLPSGEARGASGEH